MDRSSVEKTDLGIEDSSDGDDASEIVSYALPSQDDDQTVWVDDRDRSQDIASGGGGPSLGSIVSEDGPLPRPERPSWACDECGAQHDILDDWYDVLVGHGCDQVSMMSFPLLLQCDQVGYQEAESIIGMLKHGGYQVKGGDGRRLTNASAVVHSKVLVARHKLKPSGAKYKGQGGYEPGDPRLDNR